MRAAPPDTLAKPPSWTTQALCALPSYAKRSDELWFASPGNTAAVGEAKRICNLCPVRRACLRAEMEAEGNAAARRRHGVRGGLTGVERRALYEELQRRQKQTEAAA